MSEATESAALVPEVVEQQHHSLGPSNYTPWFDCPVWEGRKEGEDAARGTFSHLVVQAILTGDDSILPAETPLCVEQSDIESGRWGAAAIQELAGSSAVHSEDKVCFNDALADELPLMRGVFGTVDAWFEDEARQLHICDYKTFDRGEKDHTPQMSGYALIICSRFPQYAAGRIFLHVVSGGVRRVTTIETDFVACAKLVMGVLSRHLAPDAQPCPCDACKYCAKVETCHGVGGLVSIVQSSPVKWDDMHMADKMVLVEALKKVIKNFEDEFSAKLEKEGEISSPKTGVTWKAVQKKPSRVLRSLANLAKTLAQYGITEEIFFRDIASTTQKKVETALAAAHLPSSDVKAIIDAQWVVPEGAQPTITRKRVA